MLFPKRIARSGVIACVAWCALALAVGLLIPTALVAFWSVNLGVASYVAPTAGVGWWLRRTAAPSVARLIGSTQIRALLGGTALTMAVVWSSWVWGMASRPKVMAGAFVFCAVIHPMVTALLAVRSDVAR